MGDMADMFLDAVMDTEDLRFDWLNGSLSDVEAMDLGILDEYGAYDSTN